MAAIATSAGTRPFSPIAATSATLTMAPRSEPAAPIRARSPMRRRPWINAAWPSETILKKTASESHATAPACSSLPNVHTAIGREKATIASVPSSARPTAMRRSAITVRAICRSSSEATASAIWRTPLLLTPIWATLRTTSAIEAYTPMRPIPVGPSSIAMALVRAIPTSKVSPELPPINAVERRICT